MPEVLPDHVASPRTPLVWDGTRYRAVRGHTDGTLQVRGEDQLVSIQDAIVGHAEDLTAAAGDNYLGPGAVGAGVYWVITSLTGRDSTNICGYIRFLVIRAGDFLYLKSGDHTDVDLTIDWQGWIVLEEGDALTAMFTGVTLNDNIYFDWFGHVITRE